MTDPSILLALLCVLLSSNVWIIASIILDFIPSPRAYSRSANAANKIYRHFSHFFIDRRQGLEKKEKKKLTLVYKKKLSGDIESKNKT